MKKIKKILAMSLVAVGLVAGVGSTTSACIDIGGGMHMDCGSCGCRTSSFYGMHNDNVEADRLVTKSCGCTELWGYCYDCGKHIITVKADRCDAHK
ncbi:hypothetical protein [Oceanirhabdus sp. W0125-5]|uniref:hypothetical protein n=1 Tax=Oceanirhabdus sp. W0125-5 TaxID=2999116 RepID=UPI0022F32810|nr:hypothetical protein [Oceanirhabdus sp. W0125-5]WBW95875.1 hypothetical protein OW730_19605 [Oceanirhabdus sp. W0125-5]